MPTTKKKGNGVATIDVELVVVRTDTVEIAVNTANKIQVAPQSDEQEGSKLVKNGRLLAQKMGKKTLTGNQITLTDNIFIPDLVQIFQGGTLTIPSEGTVTEGMLPIGTIYKPPLAGDASEGKIFELDAYSAVYDASGQILEYEKITYPNCQGTPITVTMEDNVFRQQEYVINSAPKTGEPPYIITYVEELPSVETVSVSELSDETGLDTI